jgi:hypothetical protein
MELSRYEIWLDQFETEVLAGFIAELLDRKELASYQVATLENVYKQLEQE